MKVSWGSVSRAGIDRLQNGIIVLLVCSALLLAGAGGLFRTIANLWQETGGGSALSTPAVNYLARRAPGRLLLQTQQGRYGVQYDQEGVAALYYGGLDRLLLETLALRGEPTEILQEDWQAAITQEESWVYYDFLANVPFVTLTEDHTGRARLFLVIIRQDRAEELLYYNEETNLYYRALLGSAALPALPAEVVSIPPNGPVFAFEEEAYRGLPPWMSCLPTPPACPVYQVRAVPAAEDVGIQSALFQALGFNEQTLTLYRSAAGPVIRERGDTFRIETDGTLIFHSGDDTAMRYQAASPWEQDILAEAEELLEKLSQPWRGEGCFLYRQMEVQPDGVTELCFSYLLHGIPVEEADGGWAARFTFRGKELSDFSLGLRQYTATEDSCLILPERQAAAIVMDGAAQGRELLLRYLETEGSLTAVWTVEEGGAGWNDAS